MQTRPATLDDVAAIAELQAAWDTHWLGAPENDESEMGEQLEHVPAGQSVLVHDDDRLVGAAWWWGNTGAIVVLPGSDTAVLETTLDQCEAGGAPLLEVLTRDDVLRAALAARGWRHERSAFELTRPVSDDWQLAEPILPDGVTLLRLDEVELADVHTMIYRDAHWASIAGHGDRPLAEWRSLIVTPAPPELQVVAVRDARVVGVALGRIFADGTGWLAQLAVAADERGRGLGRALLLEGLRRYRDAGAKLLGLGVQAENNNALQLYLGVGLAIEREWQTYVPTR